MTVALVLLSAWFVWAFRSRVTEYEISDSARLEVDRAAYPLQANVTGRIAISRLMLGQEVRAGDVLVELDSEDQRLNLQMERTRAASLAPQIAALRSQMQSEREGRLDEQQVFGFSAEGARAQYREAETQAVEAEQQAQRATLLQSEGIMAKADADRAQTEAHSRRAAADRWKVAVAQVQPELQVRERDREIRQKKILAEIAKMQAEMAASSANIERLEYDIERQRIRAPISGRLSECAVLSPGSHVSEGQQVGVVLASGNLHAVAGFQPSAAFGKIRPGQRAALRLQGFPWAQYGTVPARVSRVAGEIRDGKVRVELAVYFEPRSRIPFQHGLPGSVEVEIERVSPAALLLRSAGKFVGAR